MGKKKNAREAEKQYQDCLDKERSMYIEHQYDQLKQCDQNLFIISSGVFGLSFTFLNQVVKTPSPETRWVIITSWAIILFCIIISLLAYIISYYAHKNAIKYIDCLKEKSDKAGCFSCKLTISTTLAEAMNIVNLVSLSIGLILLLVYVALNL